VKSFGLIIILGSPNSQNDELYSIAKERYKLAIQEYQQHPSHKILLSSGFGALFNTTNQPHAFYLKQYLISRGIPVTAFTEFAMSRNTLEDASLSKPIVLK
jgi:uncharacterized SAM-binding protein YcdF (DUF218 family)